MRGHRIQRIPPTETRGRVHTSTVTVAVTDPNKPAFSIKENDLKIEWYSGTGSGGQHRNKHQNSCRITHIPSGVVSTAQCRSRENSYNEAFSNITQKVLSSQYEEFNTIMSESRKKQVGSGMRGDKIRTYRFQDDSCCDHRTDNKISLKKIMSGNIDLFW